MWKAAKHMNLFVAYTTLCANHDHIRTCANMYNTYLNICEHVWKLCEHMWQYVSTCESNNAKQHRTHARVCNNVCKLHEHIQSYVNYMETSDLGAQIWEPIVSACSLTIARMFIRACVEINRLGLWLLCMVHILQYLVLKSETHALALRFKGQIWRVLALKTHQIWSLNLRLMPWLSDLRTRSGGFWLSKPGRSGP